MQKKTEMAVRPGALLRKITYDWLLGQKPNCLRIRRDSRPYRQTLSGLDPDFPLPCLKLINPPRAVGFIKLWAGGTIVSPTVITSWSIWTISFLEGSLISRRRKDIMRETVFPIINDSIWSKQDIGGFMAFWASCGKSWSLLGSFHQGFHKPVNLNSKLPWLKRIFWIEIQFIFCI